MYKVIKIGETEVPMMAVASSIVYYRKVFREDFLAISRSGDDARQANAAIEMGFIMAKTAELDGDRKEMLKLTEDNYIDWMDQFSPSDILGASSEMAALYYAQDESKSKAKKQSARQ